MTNLSLSPATMYPTPATTATTTTIRVMMKRMTVAVVMMMLATQMITMAMIAAVEAVVTTLPPAPTTEQRMDCSLTTIFVCLRVFVLFFYVTEMHVYTKIHFLHNPNETFLVMFKFVLLQKHTLAVLKSLRIA